MSWRSNTANLPYWCPDCAESRGVYCCHQHCSGWHRPPYPLVLPCQTGIKTPWARTMQAHPIYACCPCLWHNISSIWNWLRSFTETFQDKESLLIANQCLMYPFSVHIWCSSFRREGFGGHLQWKTNRKAGFAALQAVLRESYIHIILCSTTKLTTNIRGSKVSQPACILASPIMEENCRWTPAIGMAMADLPPAPEKLMQVISCKCQTDSISLRCTCKKYDLEYTPSCGNCNESGCTNLTQMINGQN